MSCNSVKRIPEDDYLIKENTVYVDNEKADSLLKYVYQKPNKSLLGMPLRLYIYNLARPNIDSILNERIEKHPKRKKRLKKILSQKQLYKDIENKKKFNNWLKTTGEKPTVLKDTLTKRSEIQLKNYFFNNGWFNARVSNTVEKRPNKKAKITYKVNSKRRYYLDTISREISSKAIDSILNVEFLETYLKKGAPYQLNNITKERDRITGKLRNSGVYHFSQDYITFDIDTLGNRGKVNVDLLIKDRTIRTQDTTLIEPFKVYKVKDVNIFTNNSYENQGKTITDSATYKGFNLYSVGKLRYNPKSLSDAVFITPNTIFKDVNRARTYRRISNLRIFKYPSIEYVENPDTTLTANIYLSPLKRFSFGFSTEASQSNIQSLGIALNPSFLIRNVFRGAETFEISGRGSIAASKDAADNQDQFFDIKELGANLKLTIPRLFSPFNTDRLIPKYMFPVTRLSMLATGQTNIGLDKQTFTGAFNYKWYPNNKITNSLDIFNLQYVRNLNISRYFEIYGSSYDRLNTIAKKVNYINTDENLDIPGGANAFMRDVIDDKLNDVISVDDYLAVNSIKERKDRLTENNLILSTNFNYIKNNRKNLLDNNFSIFKFRFELAGNTLSLLSNLLGQEKKSSGTKERYELFNVAFSQYFKAEIDFIKHWDLGSKNVIAARTFLGAAIPYGNSSNIPFSKSFFAGGANDNRAWTVYGLGPGSSIIFNEFHEANMKLALSLEDRFNIFGSLNGAIFIDAGNIWNLLDDINVEGAKFDKFASLQDIAIGSGVGVRYDFDFFILRFDIGFKTYDPTYPLGERWFKDYNLTKATFNVGINYPF